MKRHLFVLLMSALIAACTNPGQHRQESLDVTEASIDQYVDEKLDTSQTYEIIEGLRFSKDESTYTAVQFSQNDTVILCTEEITDGQGGMLNRNIFFKNNLPVLVEEYEILFNQGYSSIRQRKIYFNGAIILKAYEKTAMTEEELFAKPFKETTMTMNQFDFQRPKDAVLQKGDYEMKFGEFLVFDLNAYLILENKKSGYNVALFILKGDELIDALYANPEAYQGQTIHPYHDFMSIGGMDQMVYTGGFIVH